MDRLRTHLKALPGWILTVLTLAAILWLTLAPHPLGEQEPPQLFEGEDKVVHALMFGFLTFVALVDWARGRDFDKVRWPVCLITAAISTAIGIAVEYAQRAMAMGRGFDIFDMVADGTGAFAVAIIWIVADCLRDRNKL